MTITTTKIRLPALHKGQHRVRTSPARFKVLCTGRRWGKTLLGSALCVETALKGGRAWWVAPSYQIARVGWMGAKDIARQLPETIYPATEKFIKEGEKTISFNSGGELRIRSADDPDSLRGVGLDYVVLDEAAFMKESAWTESLRPALSDRLGKALIISTPKGRNWFYRVYQYALSGDDSQWAAFQYPTTDNPFIADAEVEIAYSQLPEAVFRQEYLAEFVEDAGLVFRNVRNCIRPTDVTSPQEGHRYVAGVDWAQVTDWTVIIVMDAITKQVVDIDRFNQISWAIQRGRLMGVCAKWGVEAVLAEENSIGSPNIEELQNAGLPVLGFTTTNQSKAEIIQALMLAFEKVEIGIPNDPILLSELESFEATRLPAGSWRYSAPDGMHDDTVIALALAYRQSHDVYFPVGEVRTASPYRIG